jgi:hypothetical protein
MLFLSWFTTQLVIIVCAEGMEVLMDEVDKL